MKTPRISVLLPVFNAAATLAETLQSIQAQSCEDFEVVAIDDGSGDGSGDVLLEWSRRDRRFRALLSDHRGIVEAPNQGLALCRGAYVARMDADDRMHPKRLEKQLEWLEGDPNLSVVSCLVEIFPREKTGEGMLVYEAWLNGLVDSAAIEREFFIESPIANPSAMMRREELMALGGTKTGDGRKTTICGCAIERRAGALPRYRRSCTTGASIRGEPHTCKAAIQWRIFSAPKRIIFAPGRCKNGTGWSSGARARPAAGSPSTWSARAVLPIYLSISRPRKSAAPCGASP